jgi:hypothetical protein
VAVTGNFDALAAFHNRIKKLPEAARKIAIALSPKVEKLVDNTIATATTPYGEGWVPKKDGGQALAGSDSGGRVLVRLVGKATIRTAILYPYHFHDAGTHTIGRKRGAAIRRSIVGAAARLAVADIKVPRKRKDETEFAYQQRLATLIARRNARVEAVKGVKNQVSFAIQEARAAGGIHNPERQILPREEEGIPTTWSDTIRDEAVKVMAAGGATLKGGS